MNRLIIIPLLAMIPFLCFSRNPKKPVTTPDTTIYTVVDKMPEFPGGSDSLESFISYHYIFPIEDSESAPMGRTIIQFIIEKDGSISHIKVVRGVDPYIDREAVRVVKILPKWIPGALKGKIVRVRYVLPVSFRTT
jgi:periplasmic protein TonB